MYNQILKRAMNKYGIDNFYYEVLVEGIETKENLNQLEEFYIKKYNSISPTGYNMCPGGAKWKREPKLNTKQELEIIKLYKEGNSSRKIADIFGVSYKTILAYLNKHNVSRRNKVTNLPNRTSVLTEEIM